MSDQKNSKMASLATTLEEQLKQIRQLTEEMRSLKDNQERVEAQSADVPASQSSFTAFSEKRVVEVCLAVKGIFKLDTIAQTFGVLIGVTMTWDCPPTETPPELEDDDGDWEPEWTPKYRIKHLMEDLNSEKMFTIKHENEKMMVVMEADHLVTIYEQLELQSFPTDLQDLTIELDSKVPSERVLWVPPKNGACGRVLKEKCYLNDFSIIDECPFTYNMFLYTLDERTVSALSLSVKVARKSSYYMLNVNALMLIICFFSLCAWSVHPADIASRHAIDFSLILTAVMFKLVLTQMLPRVSYITTLDFYVMSSFLLLMGITVVHTVLPLMFITHADNSPLTQPPLTSEKEEALLAADMVAFWVVLGVLLAFNVAYGVYFTVRKNRERSAYIKQGLADQVQYDHQNDEVVERGNASVKHPHANKT